MSLNGFRHPLFSLSFASLLALTSLSASAASACTGLEENVCKQNPDCNWVSGYTTKNGNTISAYCRSASGKAKREADPKEEKGTQSGANDRQGAGVKTSAITLEERNG